MKENKYDNDIFFEKYSHMARSEQGLEGAGEWHELEKLLPDFAGKRVLDLGCGFGWHCRYAAEHGAVEVVGSDLSEKMLEGARQKTDSPVVRYICEAMEDIAYSPGAFDVVICSLALHYVEDFDAVCRSIHSSLAPGGVFVLSVEHPVFTAQGTQDWHRNEQGEILHWPVDRYFTEGRRNAIFLGEQVTKYHRTLTSYLNTLLTTGFSIERLVEPQPAAHMLDTVPGMRDELRRPMMLLVSAVRN